MEPLEKLIVKLDVFLSILGIGAVLNDKLQLQKRLPARLHFIFIVTSLMPKIAQQNARLGKHNTIVRFKYRF